jgi:hypothetical protein
MLMKIKNDKLIKTSSDELNRIEKVITPADATQQNSLS